MDVYKIGNKMKCTIRSYTSGYIGNEYMQYDNQPYHVLKDIEATLHFNKYDKISAATLNKTQMAFYEQSVDYIKLENVILTDKILNLIYSKNEDKLCHVSENLVSSVGKELFLNTSAAEVYQVFIYNSNSELEAAYGSYDLVNPITVQNANEPYLVFYSYPGQYSVDLDHATNHYVTLDFEIIGSINEQNSKMWLHLDKCSIEQDAEMHFNNTTNTIDLTFKVLKSNQPNYITFKD